MCYFFLEGCYGFPSNKVTISAKDWLKRHNVLFSREDSPILHYVVNSELSDSDNSDIEDCALYVTADGLAKVIIPNCSSMTDDDYFITTYPGLIFTKVYCDTGMCLGSVFLEGNDMKDLLNKLNVRYNEVKDPVLHYVVLSNMCSADLDGVEDCAMFVTDSDLVKVIIPNYSTVNADDYFFSTYPNLYFSKAFCCKGELIGTIFTRRQ